MLIILKSFHFKQSFICFRIFFFFYCPLIDSMSIYFTQCIVNSKAVFIVRCSGFICNLPRDWKCFYCIMCRFNLNLFKVTSVCLSILLPTPATAPPTFYSFPLCTLILVTRFAKCFCLRKEEKMFFWVILSEGLRMTCLSLTFLVR